MRFIFKENIVIYDVKEDYAIILMLVDLTIFMILEVYKKTILLKLMFNLFWSGTVLDNSDFTFNNSQGSGLITRILMAHIS